jgi:hypothetical protein
MDGTRAGRGGRSCKASRVTGSPARSCAFQLQNADGAVQDQPKDYSALGRSQSHATYSSLQSSPPAENVHQKHEMCTAESLDRQFATRANRPMLPRSGANKSFQGSWMHQDTRDAVHAWPFNEVPLVGHNHRRLTAPNNQVLPQKICKKYTKCARLSSWIGHGHAGTQTYAKWKAQ